tara:strand:- start:169 stop:381 length:213 start_codon:yes stop_codon:yes gene_type:complete
MKEDIIKELFKMCENFNLTEKEKEALSEYIDILSNERILLQEKIKKNNLVKLSKNIKQLKGKEDGNKKNT